MPCFRGLLPASYQPVQLRQSAAVGPDRPGSAKAPVFFSLPLRDVGNEQWQDSWPESVGIGVEVFPQLQRLVCEVEHMTRGQIHPLQDSGGKDPLAVAVVRTCNVG